MVLRDGYGCGFGESARLKNGDGHGYGYKDYGCWDGNGCGYGLSLDAGGRRNGDGDGYSSCFTFSCSMSGGFHDGGGICGSRDDDAIVAVLKEEEKP